MTFTAPGQTLATDLLGAEEVTFRTAGYDATYSGTIDGFVTKTDAGRLLLTGSLTVSHDDVYTQEITVAGGILAGSAETLGSHGILLADTGRLEITGGVFTGTVTGYQGDAGILIDGHDVTYAGPSGNPFYGPITIRNGGNLTIMTRRVTLVPSAIEVDGTSTLTFGSTPKLGISAPIVVSDGATIHTDYDFSQVANIVSGGVWNKTGTGNLFLNSPNESAGVNVKAGTLTVTHLTLPPVVTISSGAKVVFGPLEDGGVYAGSISGEGAVDIDAPASLVFTGVNTYSGDTRILAGLLQVDGSIASSHVVVSDGVRLGGGGSVGSISVASGGTLAPGASIGTLHTGDVAFEVGSIFEVEAGGTGASDRVQASGSAMIGGGIVNVLAASGRYAAATTYTILSATDGRAGEFDTVTSNLAFLTPTLSYDDKNVFLTLTRNGIAFSHAGATANQITAADAIEALGGGDVFDAVVQLAVPEARIAFDQLSGEVHASAAGLLLDEGVHVRDAALQRLRGETVDGARAAWLQSYGAFGQSEGDGNTATLAFRSGGIFAGADGFLDDGWQLGGLVGYSRATFDVEDRNATGSADTLHLAAYGGRDFGNLRLRTGAAYAWHDVEIGRNVDFGGFTGHLSADYGANTGQIFGEAAYAFSFGGVTLEPTASLAYAGYSSRPFRESGDDAALSSAGVDANAVYSTLGMRGAAQLELDGIVARTTGFIGWRHGLDDLQPKADLVFANGQPFTVLGAAAARNVAIVDFGLDIQAGSAGINLSYSGQFGPGASSQAVKAGLKLVF
ncbi:autotransporter outer membrane beta-barrel domain-containing protein [Mesorhizobium comanense]|uniref:autotransporter outer membrane beta-barrel domain-containing protein n=1 Tax=Mesorhizobium comanense TaxID=2502215 RepID=UPI001484E5BE|nr:autotransporter domain-containing protein [Mesorhizobium comanense]